jgi:hypothetical protein
VIINFQIIHQMMIGKVSNISYRSRLSTSMGVLENLCQSDIINIIRIDIDGREKTI